MQRDHRYRFEADDVMLLDEVALMVEETEIIRIRNKPTAIQVCQITFQKIRLLVKKTRYMVKIDSAVLDVLLASAVSRAVGHAPLHLKNFS